MMSSRERFSISDSGFQLGDAVYRIRCGELHFTRIPRAYWRHRLELCRAMGLNTVCAYLFWNAHEPQPGKFDFSGELDVAAFCMLAHGMGLKVILRPGPYACAEWDLGGLPWWLLKHDDIRLRSCDPRYLDACQRYLNEVGKQLAPLQCHLGGPIIMVQVENEYGSYGTDREYLGAVRDMICDAGFTVPLFTSDGPTQLPNATREDIFCVVNFEADPAAAFAQLRAVRPKGPLMCGEYYPGWFDVWGKPHRTGETSSVVRDVDWMIANDAAFSLYMVHGGTSFGFTAGSNDAPFRPRTTSYDYDAPISEHGVPTEKYYALRELFQSRVEECRVLPPVPLANPIVSFEPIQLKKISPMLELHPDAVVSETPMCFEMLDQPHGCVLYRTNLPAGGAAVVKFAQVHDFALVHLNGEYLATLDRHLQQNQVNLPARDTDQTLDILVYAFGRVNYGPWIHDRKGIAGKVEIVEGEQVSELKGFQHLRFPLDASHLAQLKFDSDRASGPSFYAGEFELSALGDTFLDMQSWRCGVVWVNGNNLGRFWRLGPTQTLYAPAPFLKRGKNQIVVWDLFMNEAPVVQSLTQPILDRLNEGSR